jgi:nitric oxide dioxygenase
MTLSDSQIKLIQSNFQKVIPISELAAQIFYDKLFEYDPSLRKLFKGDIKSQGKKLMQTLKTAVKGLNDLDSLVAVLEGLAKKHVTYGVSVDDYTPVGNALLYTLKQDLGTEFTSEARKAWIELFRTITIVMRSAAYPNYDPYLYKNTKFYNR